MKKFLGALALALVMVPALASAQTDGSNPCTSSSTTTSSGNSYASATSQQLGKCVNQVYLWSLGIAGVLALLMIVLGGYYVLTAAGNAAQASKGKSYIWSSLIGIVILLGAYLILTTINPDLTRFNINLDSINGASK
jgi:hypothetical protein